MSNLELEKAAMAPRRWLNFCRSLEDIDLDDPKSILRPRVTPKFSDESILIRGFFIAPGGRYLVIQGQSSTTSPGTLFLFDLGLTSSADSKLIASVGLDAKYEGWITLECQATSDGMGLIILLCNVYVVFIKLMVSGNFFPPATKG